MGSLKVWRVGQYPAWKRAAKAVPLARVFKLSARLARSTALCRQ